MQLWLMGVFLILLLMVRCAAQEEIPNKGCVCGYPGIPGDPGHNGAPGRDGRDGLKGDKGDQGESESAVERHPKPIGPNCLNT